KGTGLGLATVYGIVKQSEGYVWVYSEVGRGTTFKIYLPTVDGPAEPLPTRQEPEVARGGTETVLVVEDEAAVRELAARVLRDRGYTVLEASTAEQALRTAEVYREGIHLLLVDVVLPGMGGKELFERIRTTRPAIKALYMSGYTCNAVVRQGILEPGVFLLEKPFTSNVLIRKVREVL
ncbi:MAG: response regulator, partial [Gemmatimonadetes bacterium]|nr:response regulator [Gemmatimonadota bacterium]